MKKINLKGFTLIELAVVLTIVALIIGGLAIPLTTRINEQNYNDTQKSLEKAAEAIIGYAILNKRLPCPDISTTVTDNRDGIEDPLTVSSVITGCQIGSNGIQSQSNSNDNLSWGDIPWKTLGLNAPDNADAWNNRLRYAVYQPLTRSSQPFDSLGDSTQLKVYCYNPDSPPGNYAPGCISGIEVSKNAAFIIFSHGANQWGSTNINDVSVQKQFSTTATPKDDADNIPQNQTGILSANTLTARNRFVSRARTNANSNAGEFDDLLYFMPTTILASKLLEARVFP